MQKSFFFLPELIETTTYFHSRPTLPNATQRRLRHKSYICHANISAITSNIICFLMPTRRVSVRKFEYFRTIRRID